MRRIMLEAFVLKSILYVYQSARWNQRKIAPKIYQNILKFLFILFGLKQPPYSVISPHSVWKIYWQPFWQILIYLLLFGETNVFFLISWFWKSGYFLLKMKFIFKN